MLGNIFQPFTSMQELNLDWILTKIKNMLRFLPDDGAVGQILRRTAHGAEWSDEQGAGGSVTSVNGMQGAVVLDASDVGALPDTYVAPVTSVNGQTGAVVIPTGGNVDSVNGQTGTVVLDASDVGALPDTYVAPVTSVNGQTGAVVIPTGGNVDSVNGQTGTVVLDASDVGALPDTYVAPVTSVNGQTGAVVLGASDVGAWSSFGTRGESLTFPYSVPSDGVIYYRFSVQNSANPAWAYIYVSELSWYIAQAYTTNGVAVAGNIPVKQGWTLTNPTRQNCTLNSLYFIPFT